MSLLARLFTPRPDPREALRPLWHRTVELSREPALYREDGVADTVAGRFDMITAVLAVVLLRLERDGLAAETALASGEDAELEAALARNVTMADGQGTAALALRLRAFAGKLAALGEDEVLAGRIAL